MSFSVRLSGSRNSCRAATMHQAVGMDSRGAALFVCDKSLHAFAEQLLNSDGLPSSTLAALQDAYPAA